MTMPAGTLLFVSGVSHRTAPVELRERLAIEAAKLGEVLALVHATGALAEVMILSTCNRLEVYGAASAPEDAGRQVIDAIARARGLPRELLDPLVYTKTTGDAVHHCFRVAASLDSMVLGEPQVLGQVKDAYDLAQRCGTVGAMLHRLMQQTFAVAKRVRTETELGRHAVSVSSAAVELAKKIFGGLPGRGALLIGAGEMGELAARQLVEQGACPFFVANRTPARARELAQALGGIAVPFEEWREVLARVDIVVTSAAVNEPIVRKADLPDALARRGHPLFFIDIALPRNVDPSVHELDGVFCYDLDDLQQVVDANARERLREARKAETLVEAEAQAFAADLRRLEAVPTIVSLREKLEAIRRDELERALARIPDAAPETREALEALSSRIVNKIVHGPMEKLHESSRNGHARQLAALVAELFGLDRPSRSDRRPPPRGAESLGSETGWTTQPMSSTP